MTKIHLLAGGKQAVAMPGATLHELEKLLRPIGRAPHSVIGSTTISGYNPFDYYYPEDYDEDADGSED